MADKDTLNLIKFKFGSFQSIKDLSSKDQSSFYFASDKPAFYNAGLWYGVSSLTSSVDEETGEVTLVINGGFGNNWKSSQVEHKFVAGMTKQQKADLEKAVSFVDTVTSTEGEDTQTIIDKWNEIVAFLAGFEETDVLLERITTLETNVTNLQNTTITGGDGLTGGGNLLGNRTIAMGTPSTITDSTINEAKGTTHTHAIDEASTEQRGIVRLNDTLTSNNTDQALTANQGRVLKEHIDDMFELIDKGNGIKEIKAKYGLWSDSFISARGVDNESGGVGGLDAQAVWDLLMQNDDATKIINVAHIPDISIAKITDIANASVANAKTLDGVALNRFPYIYGYKGSLDLNTYVDGENKFYSLFIGAGHSSIPSGATYSTLLNVAGYDADTSFQLIGCQFQDKLYYRGGSSSPDSNNYIFNKDWKQIAFRETTLSGYGITDGAQWKADGYYNMQLNSMYDNSARIVVKNNWAECFALNYTCDTQTLDIYNYRAQKGLHIGTELDFGNNIVYHAGNLSPVTTNTDQTITGVKTFTFGYGSRFSLNNSDSNLTIDVNTTGGWTRGLKWVNSSVENYGYSLLGTYGSGIDILYMYMGFDGEDATSNPSFRFYKGGKLTHKTLDVQESAHANMIANLNAELLDGLHAKDFVKYFVGTSVEEVQSSSLGYGQTEFGSKVNGLLLTGLYLDGKYGGQINGNAGGTELYYRGKTGSRWTTWKQLAFTDTNSLTPSGGTLNINGNLKTTNIIPLNKNFYDIGESDNGFNSIFARQYRYGRKYISINYKKEPEWYRIWKQPHGVSETNLNTIISIFKNYYNTITQTLTFLVSKGEYGKSFQITQLTGQTGLIKKIRCVSTSNSDFVDICLENYQDSRDDFCLNGIGVGFAVDFEKVEEGETYLYSTELNIVDGFATSNVLHGAGLNINGTASITGDTTINGKLTVTNQLTIGNATLYWDVANQCLRVNAGIASDSFLSAKGIDTTGNGQGGGGGFDAQMLWNELTISSPTNAGKVISSQFLPVQEILTPVASDISEINAEIIALQDRIANIEQALTWQTL